MRVTDKSGFQFPLLLLQFVKKKKEKKTLKCWLEEDLITVYVLTLLGVIADSNFND